MVIILRGPSGIGKSTIVNLLMSENFTVNGIAPSERKSSWNFAHQLWQSINQKPKTVYSSDDYFMKDGTYYFEAKLLSAAHNSCMRLYDMAMPKTEHTCIVDNTNTTLTELSPYATLANAYGHELHIITLLAKDVAECAARSKHNVSIKDILRQDTDLRQSCIDMPPWFSEQVFVQ